MSEKQQASAVDRALTVAGRARRDDGRLESQTMARYQRVFGEFNAWRRGRGLSVTKPPTSEHLAEYAEALVREHGYAKATARGRVAAVRAVLRLRGEPVPDGVAAWFVLREADHTADQPEGDTPRGVRRGVLAAVVARGLNLDKPAAAARDRCLVTLAHALTVPVARLVELDVTDVDLVDGALVVRVAGEVRELEHDHDPEEVCPVEAAAGWLGVLAAAGVRSGPLFRSVDSGQNIAGCGPKAGTSGADGGRLNVRGLHRIWARLVVRAGLPPSTPRDLRLGGAVDDLAEGSPLVEVLRRGGWSPRSASAARRLVDHLQNGGADGGGRSG
ncbi:hypothetical protein [Micromonospora sp. WMMC273]|uniref:hypothetical protein n=1 Tax=Micromonospora sp. WMMC273 TaxID=3015157 RepID=UPI0022B6E189|nr:hypothetical protein [Micromonospora sp. WMMC273]MCZ7478825.1 hypothetical protein [Micromonospora sp. WMMC273]MCZ7478953.1 hypothetical protein [Micromonospora sp. WMMC273]